MRLFIRIYRNCFYRKGYGIHSPFVFDLITDVIEEDSAFYAYHTFSMIREQLLEDDRIIHCKGRKLKVRKALQQYVISQPEGEFLFRLANYLKPESILAIGSSMGFAPLYLAKYNSNVQCITLENEADLAHIADQLLHKESNRSFPVITGSYRDTIHDSIAHFRQIDCLFLAKEIKDDDSNVIFQQCLPLLHDKSYVVMAGIRSTSAKFQRWKQLCQHPRVTVAIDLVDLGLLFFNPKLHKKVYKTVLP
ncbi:MAG: hypothetical protein LBE56_01155 [Tannerella sp.]|jgi:predicted O-methyltransferase YrrM|nr:hypothetical protein [Tannerella sp.]